MKFPQSVINAVRSAVESNPRNLGKAIKDAERSVRALPEFKSFRETLITHAVTELVYDDRHAANVQIKRETNGYGAAAKVKGDAASVQRAFRSVYDYFIAGMTLGSIRGKDLPDLAKQESEIAAGHVFNSRLCEHLSTIVPPSKMVRQAVSEARLRKIFEKLHGQADAA